MKSLNQTEGQLNTTIRRSGKQQNKEMKIVFFAIIVYGVYLLLRIFFRLMANQKSAGVKRTQSDENKKQRKVDLSNVEDADFEEINKDK
jgi:hypothetical protein